MRKAVLVIGWIWALPTSLLGVVIAAATGAKPYRLRPAGVWQWVGGGPVWDKFAGEGWQAITFGAVTVFPDRWKDDGTIIRHERQHTIQSFALGPLFLPVYLGFALMEWAAARDGYKADPLEEDAYDNETRPDKWG